MFNNFYGDKFDNQEQRENLRPRYEYGNQGMFPYQNTEFKAFIANVYEMDDYYLIEAELPGVKKEDIEITVKKSKITIKAVRKKLCDGENDILCQERKLGEYKRSFRFESINEDKVTAKLDNGILSIKVYKAEQKKKAEAKKIEIK
jgi:HSP20 family protein